MRQPTFLSQRERRLWWAAGLYTFTIYVTLALARQATNFLRDKNLLRLSIGVLALAVVVGVVVFLVRRRTNRRQWGALGLVALGYAAVLPFAEAPEEAIHLVQYGSLALMIQAALTERGRWAEAGHNNGGHNNGRRRGRPLQSPALTAFGLTTLAGIGDEILQGILPSRFYDTRDVVLNAIAAARALLASTVLRRAGAQPRPNSATG